MTKRELADELRALLTRQEREELENGTLEADRYTLDTLEELLRSGLEEDGQIDPGRVEDLRQTLESGGPDGEGTDSRDKRLGFIRCAYLAFIAGKPIHPPEETGAVGKPEDGRTVYECPERSTKKNSLCDFCVCDRMSNYEITKRRTQRQIPAYDIAAAAKKLGLETDGRRLCFKFIGRDFLVDWADGSVRKKLSEDGPWEEAGFNEAMTIYDLICWSEEGASVSGEYTPMQNLSRVSNARSFAGEGMFKKDEELFDGHDEELAQACRALGGTPWGKGDVSYKIPVFGDLSAVLSFWDSDEEFPASLQLMCDTNTLRFMHYETVWYMASCLLERVREQLDYGGPRR